MGHKSRELYSRFLLVMLHLWANFLPTKQWEMTVRLGCYVDRELKVLQRVLECSIGSPEFQISFATNKLSLWASHMDSLGLSISLCEIDLLCQLISKVFLQKSTFLRL